MRFLAKITSSCIWVAITVDLVILNWYACGADRQSVGQTWGRPAPIQSSSLIGQLAIKIEFFYRKIIMYALVTISPSDSTLTFSQFSFNYTVKLIHSVRDRIHEGLLNKSFKHVNNTESTSTRLKTFTTPAQRKILSQQNLLKGKKIKLSEVCQGMSELV